VKTGYIGKVANDREGRILLDSFKNVGVNTNGIIVSRKGKSGTVMGFVDRKGKRAMYLDPSVNDQLGFEEINLKYAGSAEFLHLTSFWGEKPFDAQKKLVEALPKAVKVTLDPGDIYARKGLKSLISIIERCFAVFPNESEIKLLTGKNYEQGTEVLMEMGVSLIAVKLGAKGCYVTDGQENHLIKPYKVSVVDTTGAGDAFCTGFLYGLIQNKGLFECGRLGNFVASRCIREAGAREGLPWLSDLAIM
jgi:ribokinase